MNLKIINKNTAQDFSAKYKEQAGWYLFTEALCRNPFMKKYLLTRQNDCCAYCTRKIVNSVPYVHHVDYDHVCAYDYGIVLFEGAKKIITTNCENCYRDKNSAFLECVSRIALVHKGCNVKIRDFRYAANHKKRNV